MNQKPPGMGGFFLPSSSPKSRCIRASFPVAEVFNMSVENSVEKGQSIFVSDSARDGSAFCTGAGAGTFVVISRRVLT
jgi:hypothetical protein